MTALPVQFALSGARSQNGIPMQVDFTCTAPAVLASHKRTVCPSMNVHQAANAARRSHQVRRKTLERALETKIASLIGVALTAFAAKMQVVMATVCLLVAQNAIHQMAHAKSALKTTT